MRETESLLIVGQNNAIKNNYIKAKRDNTKQNNKFRLKDRDETADHIITQKKYKTRLNWVGKVTKWKLYNLTNSTECYMHLPE